MTLSQWLSFVLVVVASAFALGCGQAAVGGDGPAPVGALEIGPNDFRISTMGSEADTGFGAHFPAAAFNERDGEFFVIWAATDDSGALAADEFEIYGQRLDAATGAPLGDRIRLSDAGTDGDAARNVIVGQGIVPALTYNSRDHEYLAVWLADDTGLSDGEHEVFGQRIDAATGAEIGNDFQISRMGTNGDASYLAYFPGVAYNPAANEYLVVWSGVAPGQAANAEIELYGQRIAGPSGAPVGGNSVLRAADALRESPGNAFVVMFPRAAYNETDDEYLIVFAADLFSENDFDIFAQRVNAATGEPVGIEFRVSDMGTEAFPGEPFDGNFPDVTYNKSGNEYFVVWSGDDNVDKETEIYGQRLNAATGEEIGADDFRISSIGPDGDFLFGVLGPVSTAFNSRNREYLVAWTGDHDQGGLIDEETEVFLQRIDADSGTAIGGMIRVSDMQGTGNIKGEVQFVSLAYNPLNQNYLVAWDGDDDVLPLVDDETEIFGQLLTDPKCGNGVTEGAEGCDDGNVVDGDGCSSTCVQEEASGTTGGDSGSTTAGTTGADVEASGGCALVR